MPTEESAPATAAAFFCNLIWDNGAQTNAQKYFPQDSPVAIAPNSFLDSSLSL
jgi:hypothetical protein